MGTGFPKGKIKCIIINMFCISEILIPVLVILNLTDLVDSEGICTQQ